MTPQVIGPYQIQRMLGTTGVEIVYEAIQPKLSKRLVLTVLSAEYAQDVAMVGKFRQTAEALAHLHHPSLLPVHDFAQDANLYYYVSPYLQGKPLSEAIERKGPLPESLTAKILREIAAGLDEAHRNDLFHGNLSPRDILLIDKGPAMVCAFNLDNPVGNPADAAPEQINGEARDARTDVYLLGQLVFEMLTKEHPFRTRQANVMEIVRKKTTGPPPSLRAVNPRISEALEQVVLKALASNRGERHQRAGDFAAAFDRTVTSLVEASVLKRQPSPQTESLKAAHAKDMLGNLSPGSPQVSEGSTTSHTLPLKRLWQSDGRVFIRISIPKTDSPIKSQPDLEVLWLGQIGTAVYVMLEMEPFDLDDEVFVQYVMRLAGPRTLSTLTKEHFHQIEEPLRSAVARSPKLTDQIVARHLGVVLERQSPAFYVESIAERNIVRHLQVSYQRIEPGNTIAVRSIQRQDAITLVVVISTPTQQAKEERFVVIRWILVEGTHYAVLEARDRTVIPGAPPEFYLLRLQSGAVSTLEPAEFQKVSRLLIDYLENNRRGRLFHKLDGIREAEVDTVVQVLDPSVKPIKAPPVSQPPAPILPPPVPYGLTNFVFLGGHTAQSEPEASGITFMSAEIGVPLAIARRWQQAGRLYLTLCVSNQRHLAAQSGNSIDLDVYWVERIVLAEHVSYLILRSQQEVAEDLNKPRAVLRIHTGEEFITVPEDEVRRLAPHYAAQMTHRADWKPIEIFDYLDSFATHIHTVQSPQNAFPEHTIQLASPSARGNRQASDEAGLQAKHPPDRQEIQLRQPIPKVLEPVQNTPEPAALYGIPRDAYVTRPNQMAAPLAPPPSPVTDASEPVYASPPSPVATSAAPPSLTNPTRPFLPADGPQPVPAMVNPPRIPGPFLSNERKPGLEKPLIAATSLGCVTGGAAAVAAFLLKASIVMVLVCGGLFALFGAAVGLVLGFLLGRK